MTQNKQYIEQHNNLGECEPCPVLASYTLAFALQLRKKHRKASVRVEKTSVRVGKTSIRVGKTSVRVDLERLLTESSLGSMSAVPINRMATGTISY
jgi:hypothetical protein